MLLILISSSGLSPLSVRTFSIAWITSNPAVARPNTLFPTTPGVRLDGHCEQGLKVQERTNACCRACQRRISRSVGFSLTAPTTSARRQNSPRARHSRDKELTPVRLGSSVGHAEHVGPVVLEQRVELVFERGPPQGLAPGAVAERISCLEHLYTERPQPGQRDDHRKRERGRDLRISE